MNPLVGLTLLGAAALEVGGDAVIRIGLRGDRPFLTGVGMLILGSYGVVVNQLRWDFGRLLGVYVAVFALVSLLAGRVVFAERVSAPMWVGLALILTGGAVMQFGPR